MSIHSSRSLTVESSARCTWHLQYTPCSHARRVGAGADADADADVEVKAGTFLWRRRGGVCEEALSGRYLQFTRVVPHVVTQCR